MFVELSGRQTRTLARVLEYSLGMLDTEGSPDTVSDLYSYLDRVGSVTLENIMIKLTDGTTRVR